MTPLPQDFDDSIKTQLFEGLSENTLQSLLQHSVINTYEHGRLLTQQGDKPEFIYLVISGTLRTSRMNENGEEVTIRMLTPGDTCMEAVIFMGGPSPINVQVLDDARVLMIPEKIVKLTVLEDTQFSLNLLRIVTRHYKNAMHQIDAMNIKSPLQRVGYYFLTKHLETGQDNVEFPIRFKKQTVANHLGMTPETFSRTLKRMKDMGIEVQGESIKMKDSFALCHFCDSDTQALCPVDHDCDECMCH